MRTMKTVTNNEGREIAGFLERLLVKNPKGSRQADMNRRINKLIRKLK